MPIIDSLGTWDNLGTLTPTENWNLFNYDIIGENTNTFRLSFTCDWSKRNFRYGSYGLLRFYYPTANDFSVSPSVKVWPQETKQVKEIYLPKAFAASETLVKTVGLKKVNKRYGYEMPDLDPVWTLKLEVLLF